MTGFMMVELIVANQDGISIFFIKIQFITLIFQAMHAGQQVVLQVVIEILKCRKESFLHAKVLLDPVPIPISDNQHPALDHMHLVPSHRNLLNPLTFNHANSIQATLIINTCLALIANAIRLSITLSLVLLNL